MRINGYMVTCDHCGKRIFVNVDDEIYDVVDGWEATFIPQIMDTIYLCPDCKEDFFEVKSNYEKNINKLVEDYKQKIAEYTEGGKTDIGH